MLYFDEMRPIFTLLDDHESVELLLKIFDYAEAGIEPVLNGRLASVWPLVRSMIDRGTAAYQAKCDQRKKAAQARWNRERKAKEKPG